jgi:tRNA wybutosine-synthesizing protein 3
MVLSAALQAGFRESGATNLISAKKEPATPMVAVRSMGLAFESFVGYGHESTTPPICMVSEETLECLVDIANKRFKENTERIDRFRRLLKNLSIKDSGEMKRKGQDGEKWEDPEARRERKRAEGLMKSRRMEDGSKSKGSYVAEEALDLQLLNQNP